MIFLVQINYTKDHSETMLPLGILSAGSALKKQGFEVELVNITERQISQARDYMISKKPLFIGLSVMTGIQTEHSSQLSKEIKLKSNIPVLWGGIHPSLLPRQCLAERYIDYIVVGEAEETIVDFAQAVKQGRDLRQVLGLGFKKNHQLVINPARLLIEDLDKYRLDFSLIDPEKYIFKLDKYERAIAQKTSRGCPFNCAFCYNLQFNQGRWRAWSVQAVLEDIDFLKKSYRIDAIKFYDDNFFVNKERALEILEKSGLPAHTELRIDAVDESLVRRLKELGSYDLLIGVESGSNRLLKMINKKITVDDIIRAVKILAKYNLKASYSAMVGLPTETKKEFYNTIDLLYRIYKIQPQAAFTLGAYLPYPGSALYEFSLAQGFKPPTRTEDWGRLDRFRNRFSSPWVDAKQVWKIREYFKFLGMKLGPIKKWIEFRIRKKFFVLPLDIYILEYLSGLAIEQRGFFGKFLRKIYNLLRR